LTVLLDEEDCTGNLAGRDLVAEVIADLRDPDPRKTGRDGRPRFGGGPVDGHRQQ
jgi:hypothetical protein